MSKNRRIINFNIIFWTSLFLYKWIGSGALFEDYAKQFAYSIFNIPVAFLTAYFSFHVVFEKEHHAKNKYSMYAYLVLIGVIAILMKRTYSHFYFESKFLEYKYGGGFITIAKLLFELVSLYLMVGMYGMFYFINRWYEQRQQFEILNKEKVKSELDLLKSQVQPHFIFNMLNNIYAGAIEKSPETAHQIIQLSEFIEYNLYHSQKEFVSLEEEINFIQNYVALHKIRLGEKLKVDFQIIGDTLSAQIPPLLLLPIIENCIKHGVNNAIGKSWIKVNIEHKVAEKQLEFTFLNSFEEAVQSAHEGIGIANIKKRLALYYPNNFKLHIHEDPGVFNVNLIIKYD